MAEKKESLVEHILREIETKRAELAKLERLYEAAGGTPDSKRKRYLGMRVWRATYEYLSTLPEHKAPVYEILAELESAEVPLGRYPKRTLSSAITSRFLKDLFEMERVGEDDVIRLKRLLDPEEKRRQPAYPESSRPAATG
jgi:hypothetical protein